MRFALVNYGVGNLFSLRLALRRQGVDTVLTKKKSGLKEADGIVLPGVGSFRTAAERLPREDLRDIVSSGKPTIGICLGMQLFLQGSDEGQGEGLGLLPGRARRLPSTVKVPHVGWNTLVRKKDTPLTDGLPERSWVYYVHSYYPETDGDWVVASTLYGVEYPGIVSSGSIVGTQFHPEKSGPVGDLILRNMVRMAR